MTRWIIVVIVSVALGVWLGRHTLSEVREVFTSTTPREAYVDRLEDAGLGRAAVARQWVRNGAASLRSAPLVAPPFREAGYLDPTRPEAVSYRFAARSGQRLALEVRLDPPSNTLLFLELFRVPEDSTAPPVHVLSADSGVLVMEHEPRRDAEYIVRIQPELLRGGRYVLTATLGPTLAFPVADAGVGNIQSFWGAPRDGGARAHHGVDIFAPRGTPVVAAARGVIRSVRTTSIGGRVVWLRDEARSQSIYYAHLEAQLVEAGQLVRPGDTLGLVGNSGNARSTPPHLHFGIYRRGFGPVDPLPAVRPPDGPPRDPSVDVEVVGGLRRTATGGALLRSAPADDGPVVRELPEGAPLRLLAAIGAWYRVAAPDGRTGFIAGAATEPLTTIRTTAVADSAALKDRPGGAGVEVANLRAGEEVEVLGGVENYLYVRSRGRTAWVERGAAP